MIYTVLPALPVQVCICCGCEFVPHKAAKNRTERCKPCSRANSDGYWRTRKRKPKQAELDEWDFEPEYHREDPLNASLNRCGFELVIDPTGDFRPGAKFSSYDLTADHRNKMTKGVYARREWAAGTTWRDIRHGKIWRVNELQKLEEVTA